MKNKKLNITPLHDRIVIEPVPEQSISQGGIIIPDSAKEKPIRGVVMSCGKGRKDEPVTVKIGDIVLYGKHAGSEIEIDSKKYLIMREADILAII